MIARVIAYFIPEEGSYVAHARRSLIWAVPMNEIINRSLTYYATVLWPCQFICFYSIFRHKYNIGGNIKLKYVVIVKFWRYFRIEDRITTNVKIDWNITSELLK